MTSNVWDTLAKRTDYGNVKGGGGGGGGGGGNAAVS